MYYIIFDGHQEGPFSKDELQGMSLAPDTYVWREGLQDWVLLSELPEYGELSEKTYTPHEAPAPIAPPANPVWNQPAPQAPSGYNGSGLPSNYVNWQPWAIVATVVGALFSCIGMIFGIIGIVNADKANRFYSQGYADEGSRANSSARTMTLIAFACAAAGLIITIVNFKGSVAALSMFYQ